MGKIKITTRRKLFKCFALLLLWKDGAVVRALNNVAQIQIPVSMPYVGFVFFLIIWGLSLFYMWVEFVLIWLILICGLSMIVLIWFFSGYSGLPLSSKTNISKFWFDQESWRQRTTLWMCYLQCTCTIII